MATESVENLEPTPAPEHSQSKPAQKRRIITFVVVTLLNISLLALLWTQLMAPHSNNTNSAVGNAPTTLQGQPAPDFTLPVLSADGGSQQLSMSDLKGKVVLVNFWYSSCDPCKAEAPFLQQAWTKLQSQGVVLLGVDTPPDLQSDALTFMRDKGITYTNVYAGDNKAGIAYGITGNPETFFIDRDGKVVSRWRGPLTESSLRTELAQLGVTY
jgi:cytochrome c biogenesis protein CcmG/thiol:disulfide interchange protein DsbE